mmetsp:Transcript_5421/g.7545  ORF Transcript_5421/g.7545 Transcript_5421/m.7545 type:complete len:88 (+) Transcript_5421:554-817(+)
MLAGTRRLVRSSVGLLRSWRGFEVHRSGYGDGHLLLLRWKMPARRLAAPGGVPSKAVKNAQSLKGEGFGNRGQRIVNDSLHPCSFCE